MDNTKVQITLKELFDSFKKGQTSKDELFFAVWDQVKRLSSSLIRKYNRTMNEEYEDLMQASKLAVLEHLLTYDPERTCPSTYFAPYINEAQKNLCLKGRSRYYCDRIKEMDDAAHDAGYEDLSDSRLSEKELSELSGRSIDTVRAVRYQKIAFAIKDEDISDMELRDTYNVDPLDRLCETESIYEASVIFRGSLSDYEQYLFIEYVAKHKKAKTVANELMENDGYRAYGLDHCPSDADIRRIISRGKKKMRDEKAVARILGSLHEEKILRASDDELSRLIYEG